MNSCGTLALLFTLAAAVSVCQAAPSGRTLLISLDGFRWDYVSKTSTPNLDKLISGGVHVKQVTNAYATLTMPNHWTLVTGMYEEDHGIIANKFYDAEFDDTYSFSTDGKWYNTTVPLWITAEREGKKSGAYMWIGNQATYDGLSATKVTPYKAKPDFRQALSIVTDWLETDGLTFACLYTNEPDSFGHEYGPNSDEVKYKVRVLDELIGEMMDKFDELGLSDSVNIMITSDHGMTDVSNENMLNLGAYVDFSEDVDWSYTSAVGLITPKPGKLEKVYTDLKTAERELGHMVVYKREDIPDDLHYKNNSRITDIVVVADNGWLLKKTESYSTSLKGNHGFDNKNVDMKTTFIARGPDFKCGYTQDSMRSVDVYPLICKVLGLETCHSSRGSLSNSAELLSSDDCHILSSDSARLAGTAMSVFIISLLTSAL